MTSRGGRSASCSRIAGEQVEPAPVVADRDDQPGTLDRRCEPHRTVRIGGGQRLLDEERDAALDEPLADRHGTVRRHAHPDDVGAGIVEHRVDVRVRAPAPRPGCLGRRIERPRYHPDQLGPLAAVPGRPRCVCAIQPVPTIPSRSRDPPPAVTPTIRAPRRARCPRLSDGSRPTAPTNIATPITNAHSIASGSLAPPTVP